VVSGGPSSDSAGMAGLCSEVWLAGGGGVIGINSSVMDDLIPEMGTGAGLSSAICVLLVGACT
jgi:hypothetical protein